MKLTLDMHFIRKHILRVVTYAEWVRFRDMRPKNVDSNLYSYHLKCLIKEGYIEHDTQKGYRLSPAGMRFVDHISLESFEPRWQPKLLTMLVVVRDGHICLWPKYKQPFIGSWSLPSGKVHFEDVSVERAAVREIGYLTDTQPRAIRHCGVVEFSAGIQDTTVSHTVSHVFLVDILPEDITHPKVEWITLDQLSKLTLSPGTHEIIQAAQSKKEFFYLPLTIDWE